MVGDHGAKEDGNARWKGLELNGIDCNGEGEGAVEDGSQFLVPTADVK